MIDRSVITPPDDQVLAVSYRLPQPAPDPDYPWLGDLDAAIERMIDEAAS